MARIGVDQVHYAVMTSDPAGGVPTYDAPVQLPGVSEANVNPNSSSSTLFLDDGPADTATTLGEGDVSFMWGELTIAERALLLGHTIIGGIMNKLSNDTPPYVAVGFRSLKSDGTYRYYWFPKIKFREPEMNHNTRGESIDWQLDAMAGAMIKRQSDQVWQSVADEGQSGFTSIQAAAWFDTVPGSVVDITAPSVQTIVPADLATAIAVGDDVVITFSEAMNKQSLIPTNFLLTEEVSGLEEPNALSYDSTGTIVTINPTSNLAAATAYRMTITTGVEDLSGNPMAATFTSTFTTA